MRALFNNVIFRDEIFVIIFHNWHREAHRFVYGYHKASSQNAVQCVQYTLQGEDTYTCSFVTRPHAKRCNSSKLP